MGELQTVLDIGLPLGIFCVMFWLGLELRIADFRRVLSAPKAFLIGIFLQVFSLPAIAISIILLWPTPLPDGIIWGVMILAASPGGITSNLFTRLAGGDTALSISLTAFMTLASIVTVPVIVVFAQWAIGDPDSESISVTRLALALFLIVTLPVALGVFSGRWAGQAARRVERVARRATVLLVVVLLGMTLVREAPALAENFGNAALAALALNLAAMIVAIFAARLARTTPSQATALSLECGLQSTPTALTLVVLLDLPADALLPAAFYGIWMIVSASVFTFFRARMTAGSVMAEATPHQ